MTGVDLAANAPDEILRRDLLPLYFPDASASAAPTFVLVAGQPGAGRSRASSHLAREHSGDLAIVRSEELRAFHPASSAQSGPVDADALLAIGQAVSGWVSACIRHAREHRRSVALEGTFANIAAAIGTAERFAAAGFATRVVVVGSRRSESLLSVTSQYLRDVQAGRRSTLTTRHAHDEGLAATRRLVASVEESEWADRLTIVDRSGGAVFDRDRSGSGSGFAGAVEALAAVQAAGLSRFDATQWLSELHHTTRFASTARGLPAEVTELLVDLHEMSLREVIPHLHVPAGGKFATAIEQKTVASLVDLRQTLPPAGGLDVSAPVIVPAGPERGGVSR